MPIGLTGKVSRKTLKEIALKASVEEPELTV